MKLNQQQWLDLRDAARKLESGPVLSKPDGHPSWRPDPTPEEAHEAWRIYMRTWVIPPLRRLMDSAKPEGVW